MSSVPPEEPSSLRSYRLIAEIGRGGMANVYLAVARGPAGFNKLVVIKKIRKDLVTEGDSLAMFLDEARLSARMNHPNVVQTYEIGQEGDRYFIAMEYLDGQPYSRVLSRLRKKLPFAHHVRVIADLCAGLHHAHELRDFDGTPLGVVHRDATPQNVFITYDGSVKVVDFGIAKAHDASSQTRTGVVKGKVTYMAPEQVRGEKLDRRTDVFAAGVMLWEAIACRRMWDEMPDVTIVHELMYDRIPAIAATVPNVPPELTRIVDLALAPSPANRYATALDLNRDLEDYLARSGQRASARDVGEAIAAEFEADRQRVRTVIESQLKDLRWTGVYAKATAQDLPTIDTTSSSFQGLESNPSLSVPVPSAGGVVLVPDGQRMTGQHAVQPPHVTPSAGYQQANTQRSAALVPNEGGPVTSPSTRIPVAMPPGPISVVPTNAGTALPMPQPPQPSRSVMLPIVVAATAMLAVVAVGIRFVIHPGQPAAATQPAVSATASAAVTTSAPPAPDGAQAAVKLSIRAKPAEARIYLDEVLISTGPFEGKVLRSDKYRLVRVEAEGYQPKEEEVVIGSDLVLSFDLQKADKRSPGKPGPGGKWPPAAPTGKPLHDIDSDSPYGNKK
jgi:serine/threonine-protein kinase